ncbi:MAG TPA: DUF2905 domain-containing protein [Firmicutes bacterium]|nr:DUF2905 domain-containing protein [Bacillota bacterium]
MLLGVAAIIAVAGVVFLLLDKLGLGRLPGDIIIRRENLTIFFPIATMILISIILTLLLNFLRRF